LRGRDGFYVASPLLQGRDFLGIDIESQNLIAHLAKSQDQGKAHIAQANDSHPGFFPKYPLYEVVPLIRFHNFP
jgi:hypothetical protein